MNKRKIRALMRHPVVELAFYSLTMLASLTSIVIWLMFRS
jgi:hypothetical protein